MSPSIGFLTLLLTTQLVSCDRFLVTAPNVFHVGVKERVSVQLGPDLIKQHVSLYLEHEVSGEIMSNKIELFQQTKEGEIVTKELEVHNEASHLTPVNGEPPYLLLVFDVKGKQRQMTRVLVSRHRGYIFIQTNQPIYNPTQTVLYRIFTLDHAMRPHAERIHVSIMNAGGNQISSLTVRPLNGIITRSFNIPDVSEPGVWKIKAHYDGDERNAATRDFKVQKFVLPSFETSIKPEKEFFLANSERFSVSFVAKYSYGEEVNGSFHSRFGLKCKKDNNIRFIKGMEKTGKIQDGKAEVVISTFKKYVESMNMSLDELIKDEAKLYISVSVIDIISGELQEAETTLPIVGHPYLVDTSRLPAHFIPGHSFIPAVVVRLPNGAPAPKVPVQMELAESGEKSCKKESDLNGVAECVFNPPADAKILHVTVSVESDVKRLTVARAVSLTNSFLYIQAINSVVETDGSIKIGFKTVNAEPVAGFLYYMVFNKGQLVKTGATQASVSTFDLPITRDLVPSFRLVAYFYLSNGDVIANSLWIDVEDVCKGKISLSRQDNRNDPEPGRPVSVNFDLGTQEATVALLGVDKAVYGLTSPNKLTPKQVFASMQSYDLGCSYGGGEDTAQVFNQAGISFISSGKVISKMREGFGCKSGFRHQKRSLDLQTKLSETEQRYPDARLRKCCHSGLVLMPMQVSCDERAKRVQLQHQKDCVEAFLDCCRKGALLREQKWKEDRVAGLGRTASGQDIEYFFDNESPTIRHYFPPSFHFAEIHVNGKRDYSITMPESITTWEMQAVSVSKSHGVCVAEPLQIRVYKKAFLSLRLPYSVRRFEQLSIPVAVYNYEDKTRELAVHMSQQDGLCSPATKSSNSYQNVTLKGNSHVSVLFSAIPMVLGEIPIIVQLYDRNSDMGVDAIQKTLSVKAEGILDTRTVADTILNLDGKSDRTEIQLPGFLPNNSVPDTDINLFVKIQGQIFGKAAALPLLSPSKVKGLIQAPLGCAEQTMMLMSPTALSLRYLNHGQHWAQLPPGTRDDAIDSIEKGYERILTFKKEDGSYGAWLYHPSSTWLTALVVKVLSLVAERQGTIKNTQGRPEKVIEEKHIQQSVGYLVSKQEENGQFSDPHPVIHREMQGGIGGLESAVSLTAFITLAIQHSLPYLTEEGKTEAEACISKSTEYLLSGVHDLKTPFALAITAHCLSSCLTDRASSKPAWEKLKKMVTKEGDCKVWHASFSSDERGSHYISAEALTVETTAYALLTAVSLGESSWADDAACYLATRETYQGGWVSTQDTIVALEALSVYAMSRPESPISKMNVLFHVPGVKAETESLDMLGSDVAVEKDLKRLLGHDITATVKGEGQAKMKAVMYYYALDPGQTCDDVSISVNVSGKVQYTEAVAENYNYDYLEYDEQTAEKRDEEESPRSRIEWFDARIRRKRDTAQSENSAEIVKYSVCVSHSLQRNLTGMAVADITLLSGFNVSVAELDLLKDGVEQYISHYELSANRVVLYFNEIVNGNLCIVFGATQTIPIGLLQPAPAIFYDYYEPARKCSIFYSAPQRSKMISQLCSADVCQCAEKPCFKLKEYSPGNQIKKADRFGHACYKSPTVDYGYKVLINSVTRKSNFELYSGTVTKVFKRNEDLLVSVGATRVFAKRMQCKESLTKGKTYLIMGHDGTTKDTHGEMQYLLESRTWVEQEPSDCNATKKRQYCRDYKNFVREYELNGCYQ